MSPAHFSRKFRAPYGETPYAYLMTRRIERAKAFCARGRRSPTPASPSAARRSARSARASPRSSAMTPSQYRGSDHRDQRGRPRVREQGHDATARHGLTRRLVGSSVVRRPPGPAPDRAGSEKHAAGRRSYDRRMTVTVSAMFISVHDPDAALGFYRDALGLEVRTDVASGGFRWVTVGAAGPGRRHRPVPAARRPLAGRGRRPAVARDPGFAAGGDLPHRRPRRHLREGPGVGRRGPPGAGLAALGRTRLRLPRPVGQPRPHRPGLTTRRAQDRAPPGRVTEATVPTGSYGTGYELRTVGASRRRGGRLPGRDGSPRVPGSPTATTSGRERAGGVRTPAAWKLGECDEHGHSRNAGNAPGGGWTLRHPRSEPCV